MSAMSEPDTQRLEQLLQFHDRDPRDPFITYGIAMEYAKLDNIERVLEWLDKTLSLDRDYTYAYYQKAKALADDGRAAEAQAVVDEGLAAARRKNDSHAAGELEALREQW